MILLTTHRHRTGAVVEYVGASRRRRGRHRHRQRTYVLRGCRQQMVGAGVGSERHHRRCRWGSYTRALRRQLSLRCLLVKEVVAVEEEEKEEEGEYHSNRNPAMAQVTATALIKPCCRLATRSLTPCRPAHWLHGVCVAPRFFCVAAHGPAGARLEVDLQVTELGLVLHSRTVQDIACMQRWYSQVERWQSFQAYRPPV